MFCFSKQVLYFCLRSGKASSSPGKCGRDTGEIRGFVADDAEKRFRQLAMKKFGYGKGSISKAIEEALSLWIASLETNGKK